MRTGSDSEVGDKPVAVSNRSDEIDHCRVQYWGLVATALPTEDLRYGESPGHNLGPLACVASFIAWLAVGLRALTDNWGTNASERGYAV